MSQNLKYDIFLSYSSKDKPVVRALAKQLKTEGLRVWFDEWEIRPGDMIGKSIEEGLDASRILALAISRHAFESEWATLESETFRFRDPTNKDRRFVPLRLDNVEIKDSLRQFAYVDWDTNNQESFDTVVRFLLDHACELKIGDWKSKWAELLDEPGRSERRIVRRVIEAFLDLLEKCPFRPELFRQGMLDLVNAFIEQRGYYELLGNVKCAIEVWFDGKPITVEDVKQGIHKYRNALSATLETLAMHGAKVLESGDTILLYAYSESVHAAIDKWLRDHEMGTLNLVFCQCLWKREEADQPFREALFWANRITDAKTRIAITTDAGASNLLQNKQITKVLFGAYQWHWWSAGQAWFTNTPGTLALAAVANKFDIPIFVLAENKKSQGETIDRSDGASRTLKRHGLPPEQTANGLPIDYLDPGADEVDSRDIPFVLITEEGEFGCADFGLRKRNRVTVDAYQLSVTKSTTDSTTAQSERIALRILNRQGPKCNPKYQVPVIINEKPEWNHIHIQRKVGVRVFDFVATVNESIRRGMNEEQIRRAEELKEHVLNWALSDVRTWQSPIIQEPLQQAFGQALKPYEFTSRFLEAVSYVWNCLYPTKPLNQAILSEVQQLGQRLRDRSVITLRDATLKNQILELPELLDASSVQREVNYDYYPTADDQWFDPDTAIWMLKHIPDRISWERMRRHIWHVDFELASRLTTPEDDYIHVLAMEVFKFDYDQIIRTISENLPAEDSIRFHETMLIRCYRAWARRLAYAHERPDVFAARYRHESLSHYFSLALTATKHLQNDLGSYLYHFTSQAGPTGNR